MNIESTPFGVSLRSISRKNRGRFALGFNQELIDVYDTVEEAIDHGRRRFSPKPFFVKGNPNKRFLGASGKRPGPSRVFLYTEEVLLWDGEVVETVPPEAVERVAFYKRDLLTWDSIVCRIEYSREDETRTFEIDEDTARFEEFVGWMRERLKEFRQDWREEVVLPAFEANYTVAYEKVFLG